VQRAKKSYREKGQADDSDEEADKRKKKLKTNPKQRINECEMDEDGNPLGEININKKFSVYEAKDKETVFKKRSAHTSSAPPPTQLGLVN
jgi:hypothetical protein